MAVVQDAFDIPDDIMIKILTGEYRRIGGVIRYAKGPKKGQIVKLLYPKDVNAEAPARSIGPKAMKFVKNNKKGLIISGGIVCVAVGGLIYYRVKMREPAVVKRFRKALRIYIEEIQKGNLNMDTLNNLMLALEEIKKHKDYERIKIVLSAEDFGTLVNKIHEYTVQLAENNKVEMTEEERRQSENPIINLQKYLKTQKRIFDEAA